LCIVGSSVADPDLPVAAVRDFAEAADAGLAAVFFGLAGFGRDACWLLGFFGLLLISISRFRAA